MGIYRIISIESYETYLSYWLWLLFTFSIYLKENIINFQWPEKHAWHTDIINETNKKKENEKTNDYINDKYIVCFFLCQDWYGFSILILMTITHRQTVAVKLRRWC